MSSLLTYKTLHHSELTGLLARIKSATRLANMIAHTAPQTSASKSSRLATNWKDCMSLASLEAEGLSFINLAAVGAIDCAVGIFVQFNQAD
jgi:hypothetical protein